MLPGNSLNNCQRRSSILKPPKSRQPFQDLDFNTSLPEISPESTKRRRVSFAEKKHVKEFCDHKEQGTIWDNTYEEADQNISKSIEVTQVNNDRDNARTRCAENINFQTHGAGFNFPCDKQDLFNSETHVTVDPIAVETSSQTISLNSETNLFFTDVMPCSRGTSNYAMSQTILGQDCDLEITEVLGGIEPTVSLKKIIDSKPRKIEDYPCIAREMKNTGEATLFNIGVCQINFTEVVGNKRIQAPILPTPVCQDRPAICQDVADTGFHNENKTMIFDDSTMELTLIKPQTEADSSLHENIAPRIAWGNASVGDIVSVNNDDVNDCKSPQGGNETVFFDDFGCEMTEAIATVRDVVSEVNLTREKLATEVDRIKNCSSEICAAPGQNMICSAADDMHNLSNESDSTLTIANKYGNETILFEDFGCEMTNAISTLSTSESAHAKNVIEKNDAEQIVPHELLAMHRSITDMKMEIGPAGSQIASSNNEPLVESSPKPISGCSSLTQIFNDPTTEFATSISKGKIVLNEGLKDCTVGRDQTVNLHNTEVDIIEAVEKSLCRTTAGTAIAEEKSTPQESVEQRMLDRNRTVIFDNYHVDITEAVKMCPCTSDSGTVTAIERGVRIEAKEHRMVDRNTTVESCNCNVDVTGAVKTAPRTWNFESKSIKGDADCSESLMLLTNGDADHDLVQSLLNDHHSHVGKNNLSAPFVSNCKRLRVTSANSDENGLRLVDDRLTEQTRLPEHITRGTMTIALTNNQDALETQSQISDDAQAVNVSATRLAGKDRVTASDPVSISAQKNADNTDEDVATPSNCWNNQEGLVTASTEEAKAKEFLCMAERNVDRVEFPFVKATPACPNSHSEPEIRALSHSYKQRKQSVVETSDDAQSCLEPNNCLDSNDDCCFVMFREDLEKHARSEHCIWTIRSIDVHKVLIDFISKSLVVAIHLEANEELMTPRIMKDVEIISLLPDSTDGDISMIHDILLKKLNTESLRRLCRTTQHVLYMLEVISQKVKLLLDFMYDFEKLQDLHLMSRSMNRISFRLHSYKVELIIKITIDLEPFEDIGPNDVEVECILGNIREKDIKQLITSVKKDHKFLSNYIEDIKEYIALVVEK